MKATVITNIFNEEYYLPFWLEYHRKIFDHGIVIDYDSTDKSIEIVKAMCPTWEIRRTNNIIDGKALFETYLIEKECKEIEIATSGYKIYLNTTEWLVLNRPLSEILENVVDKCYLLDVYLPIKGDTFYPRDTKDFIDNFRHKLVKAKYIRGNRFIFNRDCGHYYIGRHFTHVASDYQVDVNISSLTRLGMCVFWTGYYPINEKMWERKLQIKTNMKREIECQPAIGRNSSLQHFYSLDEMKGEFLEYSSFFDQRQNVDFDSAINYMLTVF